VVVRVMSVLVSDVEEGSFYIDGVEVELISFL
jgi:hypothetical protein